MICSFLWEAIYIEVLEHLDNSNERLGFNVLTSFVELPKKVKHKREFDLNEVWKACDLFTRSRLSEPDPYVFLEDSADEYEGTINEI